MADKTFALISMGLLVAFIGIVVWFVAEPDLTLIVVIVLAMAFYDLWRTLWRGPDKNNGDNGDNGAAGR